MEAITPFSEAKDLVLLAIGFIVISLSLYLMAEQLGEIDDPRMKAWTLRFFRHFGGIERFKRQALTAAAIAAAFAIGTLIMHAWVY